MLVQALKTLIAGLIKTLNHMQESVVFLHLSARKLPKGTLLLPNLLKASFKP